MHGRVQIAVPGSSTNSPMLTRSVPSYRTHIHPPSIIVDLQPLVVILEQWRQETVILVRPDTLVAIGRIAGALWPRTIH